MDLKNGYKVIYEETAKDTRTFYASTTGIFEDAGKIAQATIGEYKLIYEKDGDIFGSETGVPADGDYCFEEFRAVFKETEPPAPTDDNGQDGGNDDGDETEPTGEVG